MGNTNTGLSLTGRGTDLGHTGMKGQPMFFHTTHSLNVQLSANRKIARRIESFCKGIAFGDRPVAINERVYINFAKVSTSWSGVLRFGFTAHDPATLNAADLPRYACPDLTNKPGYWAKALPERYAEQENILHYYVTRSGDVFYGINNEEKGLFFGGVTTSVKLWPIIDIYGNTTAMEFVEGGSQLNNINPTPVLTPSRTIEQDANHTLTPVSFGRTPAPPAPSVTHTPQHLTGRQVTSHPAGLTAEAHAQMASQLSLGLPPVRFYANLQFSPIHFHQTVGRHVVVSADRTIAVRLPQEYCSGYVFTHRPLRLGEKLVIQILSVDNAFVGGLAFGMTACDPATVRQDQLPDDSDMLLDRPEYWVVNKDVRAQPEIGDELSFHLTLEGEVRYGKNGKFITTLMHVDKTLPMWAFFDVYGNTQKIRCLGSCVPSQRASGGHSTLVGASSQQSTGLTVALPPRNQSSSPTSITSNTAPPRPPPPRPTGRNSPVPPTLPPKQNRHHPPPPLPAPLIPLPTPPRSQPQIPPRPTPSPAPSVDEAADNACNECSVCLDEPAGCVLYTCGHICMCYACAMGIKDSGDGLCPICRREIKDVIKIFRS